MTLPLLAFLGAVSLVTSFISGVLGMAGGMILMGVLLVVLPVAAAMTLHGITQFASNGWRALMLRDAIRWRIFGGYAVGAAVAVAVFMLMRVVLDKPSAFIALGLTPFIALALPERLHLNVERRGHAFACGVVCTGLSLTAGVAGPVLDTFFVRSKMSRHAVIATKAATQSLTHAIKVAYFGSLVAGTPGVDVDMVAAALMVVLAFVGTTISRRVLERMTDASFRTWTTWTVRGLGVVYLVSGVAGLLRP
jgi:uncharacterized membrane protein YfcA